MANTIKIGKWRIDSFSMVVGLVALFILSVIPKVGDVVCGWIATARDWVKKNVFKS